MNFELHGIHTVKKRLANGEVRTYFYPHRGGPRLTGKPGSLEFLKSFEEARNQFNERPSRDTLDDLVGTYLASSDFASKAPRTQRDYRRHLDVIVERFGRLSFKTLNDPRCRAEFMRWRDQLASKPRTADALMSVLQMILSFGTRRGILQRNVAANAGHVYRADRTEIIWREAEIAAVLAVAPQPVADAMIFALWTGARQGDCLTWRWDGYADGRLVKRTNKRGAFVAIRVGGPLATVLERRKAERDALADGGAIVAPTILTTSRGTPWTSDGFRTSWSKAVKAALEAERKQAAEAKRELDPSFITGKTFNDLRGTAVTRLALAGCSSPEIASITGHALDAVAHLMNAHYLGDRATLAEQAMVKLSGRSGVA